MWLWSTASGAPSPAKLKQVLKQITSIKTELTQKERQHTSVQQQLQRLHKKTTTLSVTLKKTTKNLKGQKNILTKLATEQAQQQLKLKEAQSQFLAQLNLAYQIKQPSSLKMVLGAGSKVTPSLMLAYHRYIFLARLEHMNNIKKALAQLAQTRKKTQLQTQKLEKLEKMQEQQRQELETAQKEHKRILGSLKTKIAENNKKLRQLLIAKRNLESLVTTLTPHKFTPLSPALQGRLCKNFVWPTQGMITTHFGSPIEQSSWTWNGIIIRAPLNQEVRAISSGEVVYADWLTGYGLLLIIDHGSGYMSLYGYNKVFRKKLHEKVEGGEVIAMVGRGSNELPELYFAIRYNGRPMDPEKWCH